MCQRLKPNLTESLFLLALIAGLLYAGYSMGRATTIAINDRCLNELLVPDLTQYSTDQDDNFTEFRAMIETCIDNGGAQ